MPSHSKMAKVPRACEFFGSGSSYLQGPDFSELGTLNRCTTETRTQNVGRPKSSFSLATSLLWKEGWIGSHGKEFCSLAVPQIIAPPGEKKKGATCRVTLEPTAHLRLSRAPRRRELHDSLSSCSGTMRDGHSSKQMSHSQRQPAEFSLRTRHISLFESWSCAQRKQQ